MNANTLTSVTSRDSLLKELEKIRAESLIALRNGDFRKVAQLTLATARLNQSIAQAEGYSH
jgi:hypothetical protein